FNIYLELSESNSEFQTRAKVCLAWSYLYGVGVDQNMIKAYYIFQELIKNKSDQQNPAKFGLAKYYQTDPYYYQMAFQLYLDLSKCKSDQQNSAKYKLACCYESGKGVAKDADKAYSLYLTLLTSKDYRIKALQRIANYFKNQAR
ncbi:4441_t:CDS:1, partial [Gigaspora margarita]